MEATEAPVINRVIPRGAHLGDARKNHTWCSAQTRRPSVRIFACWRRQAGKWSSQSSRLLTIRRQSRGGRSAE